MLFSSSSSLVMRIASQCVSSYFSRYLITIMVNGMANKNPEAPSIHPHTNNDTKTTLSQHGKSASIIALEILNGTIISTRTKEIY